MEKYKIGQLSRSMGVSTHLMKHYEKFNLVSPMKDDSTNYRYYDIRQCARLIESMRFRNMGFALKDIAGMLNEYSAEQVEEMVDSQLEDLDEQIKQLQRQKYFAKRFYDESMEIDRCLDKWFVVEMDDYYYIDQTDNGALLDNGELGNDEENLLEYVPVVKSVLRLDKECFTDKEIFYHWGLGLWGKDLDFIEEKCKFRDQLNVISGGRAFCTYLKLELPYLMDRQIFDRIEEKYNEFGSELTKDAFAIRMKSSNEEGRTYHYYAVYVVLDER